MKPLIQRPKRMLVASDLHCGHRIGLTPPQWQGMYTKEEYNHIQSELWALFAQEINLLKPFDIAVWNGDLVDGKGFRSGGTELITTDRFEQSEIAADVIRFVDAETNVLTFGTPYHAGVNEDWEIVVAELVGAEIRSEQFIEINGTIFDFRHFLGSSSIPHGKGTPLGKERLWNIIWSYHDGQPDSDVIIRSHVHDFHFDGDDSYLAMTTPALQGHGTKYGARIMSKYVHFGFIHFDIDWNGAFSWKPHIFKGLSQKREPLSL